MSKKRDVSLLLEDILVCAAKIQKYTKGYSFEDFSNKEETIDAVVRNFEIIGEAASKFDPDFRTKYPEIEWGRMIGLRNRLIHDYTGINYEIVWDIIQNYIEELQFQVQNVLNKIQ
jgi:uncharacterized protein with HEPN domain